MKIHKNPWVERQEYFIPAGTKKCNLQYGYSITYWENEWRIAKASYHVIDVMEMPVVGEVDLDELKELVINAVLNRVKKGENE